MTTSNKIIVKNKIAVDLALRESAKDFFNFIEPLSQKEIVLDFKGVLSISRSFAQEYVNRKKSSFKKIKEINVPQNVKKMFKVVEQPCEKKPFFNTKLVKTVSL